MVAPSFRCAPAPLIDRHHRALGTVLVARNVTKANALSRHLATTHSQLVRQVETIEVLRADLTELASRDPLTGCTTGATWSKGSPRCSPRPAPPEERPAAQAVTLVASSVVTAGGSLDRTARA